MLRNLKQAFVSIEITSNMFTMCIYTDIRVMTILLVPGDSRSFVMDCMFMTKGISTKFKIYVQIHMARQYHDSLLFITKYNMIMGII